MRLFIGLSLPRDTRRAAADLAAQAKTLIPGRYVLTENYHVTLAFLGEAPQEAMPRIGEVLARCAAAVPAPVLSPGCPDVFGRMENGILVLRMDSEPALAPLHASLCAALRAQGLPVSDGPFSPHVTLARHAAVRPDALRALSPAVGKVPSFRADCAHLYLSARDESGILRYTPLLSAPFSPSISSFAVF